VYTFALEVRTSEGSTPLFATCTAMFEELEDAGTVQSTDVASMNVAIVDGDPSDVKHFKAEVSIKFAPCTVMERGPPVVGPNVGDRWVIVLGRVYVKSALVGEK
jgi:hypothetical protein